MGIPTARDASVWEEREQAKTALSIASHRRRYGVKEGKRKQLFMVVYFRYAQVC
jgi:hypothetical protein